MIQESRVNRVKRVRMVTLELRDYKVLLEFREYVDIQERRVKMEL